MVGWSVGVGWDALWMLLLLLGVGVRRDASMSRRGVLEFDDPMEM